ncbi:MAG: ABC transporter ATP-binding protein [Clostridia bacterium]|jgi:ABC-type lipoprotein export system ATPase subunit
MIEIKDLKKIYKVKKGPEVVALRGINITFPTYGLVFILGKSGCGKTTLLNLIGCLDKFDCGDIFFSGVSVKNFSDKEASSYRANNIGFIFQDFLLLEDVTVANNLIIASELQGKKLTIEEVDIALEEVEMKGYLNRRSSELSAGQKQRIAVARALIKDPKVILADEPTGNLDNENSLIIFELLKKISAKKLVIIVSHDSEAAQKYADLIVKMVDGNIIGQE